MSIIGYLTYDDFLKEIEADHPDKPVRIQHYRKVSRDDRYPIEQNTFLVECAVENRDEDTLLCRFKIALVTTYTTGSRPELDHALAQTERAATLLNGDLVERGFATATGLIQTSQEVNIITSWPDFWTDENLNHHPIPTPEGADAN